MCFESAEMHRKTREAGEARRLSRVIQPALAALLLLLSLAAEGQVLPGERLSGPALVGAVTLRQVNADATFTFIGHCKGNDLMFTTTLSPFNVATATAASLEDQRLLGQGPAGCMSQQGGENLIVVTAVASQFVRIADDLVTANKVVILFVVPQ